MLLTKEIEIKVTSRYYKYLHDLKYDCGMFDIIKIKIKL